MVYLEELPPHSLENEESLLGSILIDSACMVDVVGIVGPGDFVDTRCRAIYGAALELFNAHLDVDHVTIAHQLERAGRAGVVPLSYLSHLEATVPTSVHAVTYAENVERAAHQRHLMRVCLDTLDRVREKDILSVEERNDLLASLMLVVTDRRDGHGVDHAIAVREAEEEFHALTREPGSVKAPIPTGLRALDRIITGLRPRTFTVLAARPGMGKTTIARAIVYNIAMMGEPVLVITMEEARHEWPYKEALARCGMSSDAVNTNTPDPLYDQVLTAFESMRSLPVRIFDVSGATTADVDAEIRRAKVQYPNLRVVVVDQLTQLADHPKATPYERMTAISRSILGIARQQGVAMVALHQLNRAADSRSAKDYRPGPADLRDSGALEQDAHNVLLAYRPRYYLDRKDLDENDVPVDDRDVLEIIVAKQRGGRTGIARLRWEPGTTRILPLITREERA